MKQKLLIIGTVWPEPKSSAAGSRMLQLISLFKAQEWDITFATATQDSPNRYPIEDLGVHAQAILLNDDSFDVFVKELQPEIVLFDRFMVEEQFGWRVATACPDALRILDTEDLHCLRKARHLAVKEKRVFKLEDLNSDTAKREIASIFRSDLTLMISTYEMSLLKNYFQVPETIIYYLPFLVKPSSEKELSKRPTFEERAHFCTIGSFRHEPNWDSVRYLKESIWPMLREELPKAEMHVYGSYPPQKAMQLHNEKERFFIKGWAKDAQQVLQSARVCLAPLRFGAGLKGKFIDAMTVGTPCVTTPIGAEGMHDNLPWAGIVAKEEKELVLAAKQLYSDKTLWSSAQENAAAILKSFSEELYVAEFLKQVKELQHNLHRHRNQNFMGSMLLHHSMRSTEYMSRWIEAKNK
ncbi:MAG: glycosyltransferase family 4 protein [Flavicella sp.]